MVKVLVLGASGMLGSMVIQWLRLASRFDLSASVRDPELLKLCSEKNPDMFYPYFVIKILPYPRL